MSDLNTDLRLAIDTGKVVFGNREVMRTVSSADAKAVVVAMNGKHDIVGDMLHISEISSIKIIKFNGNSIELGALCGKPFSVNVFAILEPGNSNILEKEYT
ncbi:MAG: 50S ribosomal protein L30e [Candidatus Marsarchaeota archaeon]|jgi:large subunit ribosomal protein L30e|nr:50S ribosomal protein L30e [Candidatus Marsarchaeota archaeon]